VNHKTLSKTIRTYLCLTVVPCVTGPGGGESVEAMWWLPQVSQSPRLSKHYRQRPQVSITYTHCVKKCFLIH